MNSRIRYEGNSVWYPTPWDVNVTLNTTVFGYIRKGGWEVVLGSNVAFYYGRPFRGIISHWRSPFYGEEFVLDSTHALRMPPYARVDVFWRSPISSFKGRWWVMYMEDMGVRYLVIEGRRWGPYRDVSAPVFSDNASTWAFYCQKDDGFYVVVNGEGLRALRERVDGILFPRR